MFWQQNQASQVPTQHLAQRGSQVCLGC